MYKFTKHEEKIAYAGMIMGSLITLFFGTLILIVLK